MTFNTELWNGQAPGAGYEISRSLRFNSSDSAYLSRTPASAGNRKTWTWAAWVKRGSLGVLNAIFSIRAAADDSSYFDFIFNGGDQLSVSNYSTFLRITTQVFRDASAWCHLVLANDTTQATANNRLRLYVNGAEVTQFSTINNVAQSTDMGINLASETNIGRLAGSSHYCSLMLADIHFIDGQALDPTSFGEFDTNGVWQPIAYTGTYPGNSFHLDFSDNSSAAALGTDTSGNGNDWTVNNIAVATGTVYATGSTWDTSTATAQLAYKDEVATSPYVIDITGNYSITYPSFAYTGSLDSMFDGTDSVAYILNDYVNQSTYSFLVDLRDFPTVTSVSVRGYALNGGLYTPYKAELLDSSKTLIPGSTITLATSMSDNTVPVSGSPRYLKIFRSGGSYDRGYIAGFDINGTRMVNGSLPRNNDSLVDTPTNYGTDTGAGGEVRGNYATLNPLKLSSGYTLANGNLDVSGNGANLGAVATVGASTGKWYWEITVTSGANNDMGALGLTSNTSSPADGYAGSTATNGWSWRQSGQILKLAANITTNNTPTSYTNGDILQIALDADAGKVWLGKNNTWTAGGNPGAGTTQTLTYSVSEAPYFPVTRPYAGASVVNFGQRPFAYTAPSGFKALCTANLPSTTITTSGSYTGNGVADGPFVYLNGVPTAMTVNGNSVTFGTDADKLSNGFKIRTTSTTYNQNASTYNYSITSTGDPFKTARAQSNP